MSTGGTLQIKSTHTVPGPERTKLESIEYEDGYVSTAALDEFGFELTWAESYIEGTDKLADVICRNQDVIFAKLGWNQ